MRPYQPSKRLVVVCLLGEGKTRLDVLALSLVLMAALGPYLGGEPAEMQRRLSPRLHAMVEAGYAGSFSLLFFAKSFVLG